MSVSGAFDPMGKIPEFKSYAAGVEKAEQAMAAE
jgi:hypothetical protein